ncbi:MAG: hypothetical protein ACLFQV_01295 [Vulcanimicrobiota bacterium]
MNKKITTGVLIILLAFIITSVAFAGVGVPLKNRKRFQSAPIIPKETKTETLTKEEREYLENIQKSTPTPSPVVSPTPSPSPSPSPAVTAAATPKPVPKQEKTGIPLWALIGLPLVLAVLVASYFIKSRHDDSKNF